MPALVLYLVVLVIGPWVPIQSSDWSPVEKPEDANGKLAILPGSKGESIRAHNRMKTPKPTRPACPVRLRSFGPRALLVGSVSDISIFFDTCGVGVADCGVGGIVAGCRLAVKLVFSGRVTVGPGTGCAGICTVAGVGAGDGVPPVTAIRTAG